MHLWLCSWQLIKHKDMYFFSFSWVIYGDSGAGREEVTKSVFLSKQLNWFICIITSAVVPELLSKLLQAGSAARGINSLFILYSSSHACSNILGDCSFLWDQFLDLAHCVISWTRRERLAFLLCCSACWAVKWMLVLESGGVEASLGRWGP